MVKQIVVGIGAAAVFVVYSLGVRHEQLAAVKVTNISQSSQTSAASESINPAASGTGSGGSQPATQPTTTSSGFKNGTFAGSVEDAFYGNVQVSATISGGKITDVSFLQYPNTHSDSVMINQQAMPLLTQEAIQKQTAHVDIISGATFTSQAFIQSLANALNRA